MSAGRISKWFDRRGWSDIVIGAPFLWLVAFFLVPFIIVLAMSFATRTPTAPPFGFGGENPVMNTAGYARLFTDDLYARAFVTSIWNAFWAMVLCLLIGYPMALGLTRVGRAWRNVLLMLVILPFGMLYGVVSAEAGLTGLETMAFTFSVFAGASQFAALQLMHDQAPVLVVLATGLAVNLRMAMYSASLVPWLGDATPRQRGLVAYLLIDQTYALSIQHFENNPRLRMDQRLAYFAGTAICACVPWLIASALGFQLGRAIPESWALDFALPITFLAMVAPMLWPIIASACTPWPCRGSPRPTSP